MKRAALPVFGTLVLASAGMAQEPPFTADSAREFFRLLRFSHLRSMPRQMGVAAGELAPDSTV